MPVLVKVEYVGKVKGVYKDDKIEGVILGKSKKIV
jgi:hypothetical protein